jgi:hypothetical protein
VLTHPKNSHTTWISFWGADHTFSPEEIKVFTQSGAEAININPASGSPQAKYQKEGFRFLSFSNDSTSWLIAVHSEGRGAYWVGQKK